MKIKTWQYIVIGLLALVAVGLVAVSAWMTPYDLAKEQAAARAAGIPLTSAELVRPKPPPSQDAGPDWLALAALLEKKPLDDSAITSSGPLPPSAMPAVRRLLDERADVVSLAHRATDKPEAYFEHTWSPSESFKHMIPMRSVVRLLRGEALILYRQGRVDEAVAVQARGFRVADHAASDPVLISYLVSIAVEAITLAGFEDMLREAGPNPRVTALIRRAITTNPSRRDLTAALRAESLFGVYGIREIRTLEDARGVFGAESGEQDPPTKSGRSNPLVVHYVARQGEAAYLKWFTRLVEANGLPTYAERQAGRGRVVREIESKRAPLPPGEMIATMIVPVFAKAEERDIAALAKRRVVLAACDVLDYRARVGSWPARIEDTSAKPPRDPFTGKPLGYRREGSGFVLYSVGLEGTFGAKPGQPDRGEAVFRYPRAASAATPARP